MRLNKCLILLLLTNIAHASDVVVDGAIGVFNSGKNSLSETKLAKLGFQTTLYMPIKQRFNIGQWLDNKGNGRLSSTFAGWQLGFAVENDSLEANIFSGPTVISNPDIYLGGRLQFNETIFLGIRDKDCNTIGVAYNHFSSAGIYLPNIGRDMFGVEIKFHL